MENKEKIRKNNNKIWIVVLILSIILTMIITGFLTMFMTVKFLLSGSDTNYLATKLHLVKKKLEDVYIYDIDEEKMLESAIKGYVDGINDKYTQYLTEEEMKELMEDTSGNYVGIGVYMAYNTEDNTILIIGVIEDSAAEEVGLKAGDIIKKVDGIEYKGEDLEKASKAIKGEENTTVNIIIKRGTQDLEYNIKRKSIRIKTVSSEMKDNIGYISISAFNDGTSDEFKDAYNKLKQKNPSGLIIDLRNNGGGLVSESLAIAETMVKKGDCMLITSNKAHKEERTKSSKNPIVDIPVVILINQNTASASEILAGALKDNCNYKIVGTTSYGKGVIQTVTSFTDGSGLKVTTEEYFTPNHNQINKIGIIPDVEVKLDSEWENVTNIPYEKDLQLQEAIKQFNK